METNPAMKDAPIPMSDPVSLIGAGALGAFGTYIFGRLMRAVRPHRNGNGALTELHQMNIRLARIEGTLRGLEGRVQSLESGGI